jgi:hypothetical protein
VNFTMKCSAPVFATDEEHAGKTKIMFRGEAWLKEEELERYFKNGLEVAIVPEETPEAFSPEIREPITEHFLTEEEITRLETPE